MLSEEEYTGLHEAMLDRDEELVVDPESFAEAMYVPNYAPLLGEHTAPTGGPKARTSARRGRWPWSSVLRPGW
jgi:hypothetical protein